MDYKKIYDDLVEKAKPRGLNKNDHDGYFEIHHIVPRCMGGSNEQDNLVMFTGREHFIAHMLLWKIYPENGSLSNAAIMMSNRSVCKVNSYLYENLKRDFSKSVSKRKKGQGIRNLVGLRFSKLLVKSRGEDYISPASGKSLITWVCECDCGGEVTVVGGSLTSKNTESCGCMVTEAGLRRLGENNPMWGKKHTEETILKLKSRVFPKGEQHHSYGKVVTDATKAAMSKARKGILWTQERKNSTVFPTGEQHHMFGKTHTPESLAKMSRTLKARDQRPWENIATQTEESLTKWAMCDYYYNLWESFGRPKLKVFTNIYNQTHDDNVGLSFFTNPRLKWLDGWIPHEDAKWIEFSGGLG